MTVGESFNKKCINMSNTSIGDIIVVALDAFGNSTSFLENAVVQCGIHKNIPDSDSLELFSDSLSSTIPFLTATYKDNNTVLFENIQLNNWNIPELHGEFELMIYLEIKKHLPNRTLTYQPCHSINPLLIPFQINAFTDINIEYINDKIRDKIIHFNDLKLSLNRNIDHEMLIDDEFKQIYSELLKQRDDMLNMPTCNMHQPFKNGQYSFNELPKNLFALDGYNIVQLVDCAYVHVTSACEALSWVAQEYLGAIVVESYHPDMTQYIKQSKTIQVISLDVVKRYQL